MNLVFVITARPSYSRVKSVLAALEAGGASFWVIPAASALLREYGEIQGQIAVDFPAHLAPGVPSVVGGAGLRESVMSTGLLTIQLATMFHDRYRCELPEHPALSHPGRGGVGVH